jgi:hypothetical protein
MLDNLGKGIGVDKLNIGGAIISTKWYYVSKEDNLVKEQTTPLDDWLKETYKREGLSMHPTTVEANLKLGSSTLSE